MANERNVVLISLDGFPAYALDDERLPVPALRMLIRNGAMAKRMKTVNPTVTWPNHTAMVTGVDASKHGVLFNGMLTRPSPKSPVKVEPWRDKAEMVKAPTVYDLAHKAGMTTAQVDWVAIYNASTITWQFPEVPTVTGLIEKEMIDSGEVAEKDIAGFGRINVTRRDQIWTSAAIHILRKHKPNLLLYHLLNLDSTHHTYGPRNQASNSGIGFADSMVRELLEAVDLKKTTVIVVSDHGFRAVTRNIRPNAVLHHFGLLEANACDVYAVPEGGTAMVYVTDRSRRAELIPKVKEMFAKVEGIDRVIDASGFGELGYPDPDRYDQMADIVLSAKPGFGFSGQMDGGPADLTPSPRVTGSHGFLSSDPEMDAVFIAAGAGIRKGVILDTIRNVDVAPTIAELLGLKMEGVQGQPLRAIFAEPRP